MQPDDRPASLHDVGSFFLWGHIRRTGARRFGGRKYRRRSEVASAVSTVEKLTNETRPTFLVSQLRVIGYQFPFESAMFPQNGLRDLSFVLYKRSLKPGISYGLEKMESHWLVKHSRLIALRPSNMLK